MSISCDITGISDSTYRSGYGLLYNWYAVSNFRGLAPTGWHIPTLSEWQTLQTYLGGDVSAGIAVKEITTWLNFSTRTNSSGFTAVSAGMRTINFNNGQPSEFQFMGSHTRFIASDQFSPGQNNGASLSCNSDDLYTGRIGSDTDGVSVRCIRDSLTDWVEGEQVTDYDGNVYDTVQIGTQVWFKQNLKVTHYRGGETISEVTDNNAWQDLTSGALCAYNNNWDNV